MLRLLLALPALVAGEAIRGPGLSLVQDVNGSFWLQAILNSDSALDKAFGDFLIEHNKTCSGEEECAGRKAIFKVGKFSTCL